MSTVLLISDCYHAVSFTKLNDHEFLIIEYDERQKFFPNSWQRQQSKRKKIRKSAERFDGACNR